MPITDIEAKAAYNTLREYCKQHKGCEGCRYCEGTGDNKCIFEFDYHEYGVLAPADWSGE